MTMTRRAFSMATAATLAAGTSARAADLSHMPLIEAHVHLWDLTRPQGAAWPPRGPNTPFSTNHWIADNEKMTSAVYSKGWRFASVVGGIAVEASPWLEDNLWLMEQCESNPWMLGAIGNLMPEKPEFAEYLDRFRKIPFFLGIRYGNVWDYDLVNQSRNPVFIDGMKKLADAGLVWEMGNPRMEAFDAMFRVHDAVPHLTVVVEHLVGFNPPAGQEAAYETKLREFKSRKLIGKVGMPKLGKDGKIADAAVAQWKHLYESFDQDRVVAYDYTKQPGQKAPPGYEAIKHYFDDKPQDVTEKYFWANSKAVYKWKPRMKGQPGYA